MTNYLLKYSKYKTKLLKYIDTKYEIFNVFEPNFHDIIYKYQYWQLIYLQLYNFLVIISNKTEPIIKEDIDELKRLCLLLFLNYEFNYKRYGFNQQRQTKYDARFIINIVSILFGSKITKYILSQIQIDSEKIIYFDLNPSLDANKMYYIEDCYTNDLELFYTEYNKLVETKKSIFFYKSNLVNISILLKCYEYKCIERIVKDTTYYNNFRIQLNAEHFENIFQKFQLVKKKLCNLILTAYKDFNYENIKIFYIEYLTFYYNTFDMLKLSVFDDINQCFDQTINKINESGIQYFVYLSCNMPSILKFEKFETTKILISYLGFRENIDDFYNSIEIIEHDFGDVHHQYNKKISYTSDELKTLQLKFIELYNSCDSDILKLERILKLIHNITYETNVEKKINMSFIIDLYFFYDSDEEKLKNLLKTITRHIINTSSYNLRDPQIIKTLIPKISNNMIMCLINSYILKYINIETNTNEKCKELVNSQYFFQRINVNKPNYLIKRGIINYYNESEYNIFFDELKIFLDPDYVILLKNLLIIPNYSINLDSNILNSYELKLIRDIFLSNLKLYSDELSIFNLTYFQNLKDILIFITFNMMYDGFIIDNLNLILDFCKDLLTI